MQSLAVNAGFVKGELAVLKALMHFSDWSFGENITAGIDAIAKRSGLKPRQTKTLLSRLEDANAIEIVERSPGGRGRTHKRRICLERLVQMAQERAELEESSDEGLKQCNPQPKQCNARPQTVQSVRRNSAADAPNQSRRPMKRPPPTSESATNDNAGDRYPRDLEAEAALLKYGVSNAKARKLAITTSVSEIQAGIGLVKGAGNGVRSPAGMLVKLIEDGTAASEAARAAARMDRRQTPELPAWRVRRVDALFSALRQFHSVDVWSEISRSIREVRDVVPTNAGIAVLGLLSDDDLRDVEKHPREMLDKLRQAAVEYGAKAQRNQSTRPMRRAVTEAGAPR
ncbi:MAG: hypothetical protein Q9O74_00935 [Planctomycetota bacterium]|nr:hypothetical protein [Planctomycetota bacterium]